MALHFPAGLVLDMVLTEYGFAIFGNLNLEMGWAQILLIIIILFFFNFEQLEKIPSRGLISFEKWHKLVEEEMEELTGFIWVLTHFFGYPKTEKAISVNEPILH